MEMIVFIIKLVKILQSLSVISKFIVKMILNDYGHSVDLKDE